MKKRLLVLLILGLVFSMSFVVAQEEVFEGLPGGEKLAEIASGEEDPTEKIEDVKDKLVQVRKGQNYSYLRMEWSKAPYVGGIFKGTEGFFKFFNPLWKYSFGSEFSWNVIFFLHMFLWGIIIFALFYPAKEIMGNSLFAIITGIIFASITGSFGIITKFVNILDTMFNKLWWATLIFILILIALVIAESEFFKGLRKGAKKEELERAKESIKAHGEVSEEALKDMGSP
jgi:membrane protein implicated in regulation of membrane protease activity